jgi:transcriptional regulator with XRE-family HTH domain
MLVNMDVKYRFSERLRNLRKREGLSQQELSELSNIEYKHIQRLESKRPCDVKLSTLEKLASAFKMSLSRLLNF